MALIQKEVDGGDLTRSCQLVPLRTRDNLRGATDERAREADIATCLRHAGSLSSVEARAKALDEGFLLAGRFLELDAEAAALPIEQWSCPPPAFPATTQVAITRMYWSTLLALPERPTDAEASTAIELTAKVNQLHNWDETARDVFKREFVPALVARLTEAMGGEEGGADLRAIQTSTRDGLLAFPRDPDRGAASF